MPTASKKADAKKAAAPKEPKAPKVPNKCQCGCGGDTARRFMPGHDARLKGRLLTQATSTESSAADRTSAVKSLSDLGWEHFLVAAQAKADQRAKAASDRADAKAKRDAEKSAKDAAKKAAAAAKAK